MARPSRPSVRFTALLEPGDHHQDQQHHHDGRQREVVEVADEREVPRRRGLAALVGDGQREHAEHHRDQRLAGELRLAAQAEAALLGDLDVVVEEADGAEPDEQEQQQQRRRTTARPG